VRILSEGWPGRRAHPYPRRATSTSPSWATAPGSARSTAREVGQALVPTDRTAKPLAVAALGAERRRISGREIRCREQIDRILRSREKLAGHRPPMDCVAEGSFGATFPTAAISPKWRSIAKRRRRRGQLRDRGRHRQRGRSHQRRRARCTRRAAGRGAGARRARDLRLRHRELLAGSFMDYPMPRAD